MTPGSREKNRRVQLYRWLIFVLCSFFFIADSITAGSPLAIAGSVLFLAGCIIFLVPEVRKKV